MIKRPETPDLDASQNTNLMEHLRSLSVDKLQEALEQTKADAATDTSSYVHGGSPANTTKAVAILQTLIDEKTKK